MTDYTPEAIRADIELVRLGIYSDRYHAAIARLLSLAERVAKSPTTTTQRARNAHYIGRIVPDDYAGKRIALVNLEQP